MTLRTWTAEEIDYLQDRWGEVSVKGIAKKLNRTESAVINKISRLKLGSFLDNSEYITFNQLTHAVTGTGKSYSYRLESWVEKRGLPIVNKKNRQMLNKNGLFK